jgi:hypothetical protein
MTGFAFKFAFALFLGFATLTLNGCASNATVEGMTLTELPKVAGANKKLFRALDVQEVKGGKETNPLWTSQISNTEFKQALEQSLTNAGFHSEASGGKARYSLQVQLEKVEQPLFGLDMTVTTLIRYILTDTVKNRVIVNQEVTSSYTGTFQDAFYGVKRLRLANEGSARNSISQVVTLLHGVDPEKVALRLN